MRKFALAEPNWLPAENEQSDRTADFAAHTPETGKPGPPRPGNSKSNEPNPKCARRKTSTTTATTAAAAPSNNAPDFTKLQILWSARLTAGFAARALPPAPTQPQQQLNEPGNNTNGNNSSSRARSNNSNQPDPYRDIQYRNPAGQLVVRPGISQENRPMSDIEWSVQNVLRRKYPMIHREILVGALEHAGHIQPGADPDFPNSVVGILPPEERFRNGPLIDPLKQQPNSQNQNQAPQPQQQHEERQP